MASESKIRHHVSQVEFLKERARLQAERLAGGIEPRELLADPEQFARDILAAMLVDLRPLLESAAEEARGFAREMGLRHAEELELADVEEEAEAAFVAWAFPAIVASLGPAIRSLQEQIDAGIPIETVEKTLQREATRQALLAGFHSAVKSAAANVVQAVERGLLSIAADMLAAEAVGELAGAAGRTDAAEGKPATFIWLAVMDGSTCDDELENSCAPRHGMVADLEQWAELGRPGSPVLLCSIFSRTGASYCRCILEEAGERERPATPVDVKEAIAEARERARMLFQ